MKCQKCAKPAIVHLTEITQQNDQNGRSKKTVEIHLCLTHAVEAGVLTPSPESQPAKVIQPSLPVRAEKSSGAIVPSKPQPSSLAVSHEADPTDKHACPTCGMSWSQFKQGGLMGCTHDYEYFATKLAPLLKRAQEGALVHVGKVPARRQPADSDRQATSMRLQLEMQKAIDAENYEQAARLRDQLRNLGPA